MRLDVKEAEHSKITVLFVDDEPALLRLYMRALRGASFEILVAESAPDAIALIRARRVDVLVSDIDMPGMSGPELVALVRREFPATLRMLLTGAATMTRALEAINDGEVHRFFNKPFDCEAFEATIRGLRDRIEKLRRDSEMDGCAARRDALYRWVEQEFPGTLDVVRTDRGEIVIDPGLEDLELLDEAPPRP